MKLTEEQIISQTTSISVEKLQLWVRQGWVVPVQEEGRPHFDETDLARINLVCQLEDDLDLGDQAIPVVLSLIDQIHGLRRELRRLCHAVESEPSDVRDRIKRAFTGSE